MQVLINLALLIATELHFKYSRAEDKINYWIELELQSAHWKPSCLTTGGCANPRFRISKLNKFNAEIISVSWSITENFVQGHSRKFITHWAHGEPHGINLQCEVIGMDPLYGFSRTCDTTQNIEMFEEDDQIQELDKYQAVTDELATNGKVIAEIQGKCFNASFIVQKYTKHCPWCPIRDGDMTLIESTHEYESSEADVTNEINLTEKFEQFFFGEQTLLIFLLSLTLMSLLGLACLLLIISKQRHFISLLQKQSQLNTHFNTYLYSEQLAKPAKKADDRYDIPWEQKCFLQRFWINENLNINDSNKFTSSRILNRTSVPALTSLACIPHKTTTTGTTSKVPKRLSSNSSLYEHREDIGLEESV